MQISSILTMHWLCRILFLVCVLSCKQFSRLECRIANGFEMSSRRYIPNRRGTSRNTHRQTISDIKEQSSKSRSSGCKYDLGLGKNKPFKSNGRGPHNLRQNAEKQEQLDAGTGGGTNFNTYEACRFLVEYEATREYPTPIESNIESSVAVNSQDNNLNSHRSPTVTTTTRPTKVMLTSALNGNQIRNSQQEMKSAKDGLPITKTKVVATSKSKLGNSPARNPKQKNLAKVQPKRLLEDCLLILDHELADSGVSSASARSTIWSRPDTPQLDMNSVWVEMLLHNQMSRLKP